MRNDIDCKAVERMVDLDLMAFMRTIHTGISASSVVQEAKWHGDCPRLAALLEDRDSFQEAYNAAACKDIYKVAARKEARAKCIDTIHKIASNVELSLWDDTAKIAALGFPVKRHQRTSKTTPLGVTTSFTIVQTEHRGQATGKVKAIPGAHYYEMRSTEGDPTVQENYVHFDTYASCNMEMKGLVPGRQYSFCVRGRSSKSEGPWSAPVTIIAT